MANPVLVVMAAGMGSRYGGLKQIDPVGPNGQIIMHYSIYDAWKAGFRRVSEPFAVINADDFYGAQAFQCLYDYLKDAQDDDKYRYCMVGYRVENTLTENGTVSRGICEADENGYLADIVERTAISRDANGVISDPEAGEIAEGTLVSMNMWGFTPSFLDELETGLRTFMTDELPKNPAKGEYYLPFAVDHLIQNGQATAKVLQTSAQWYGVTYKEDKPVVVDALRRMTEAGLYPAE